MQDQPSREEVYALSANEVARLVLETLLARQPALVSVDELVREFAHPDPRQAVSEVFIREGADELVRCGLAHRLDGFVFASYSAVRAKELET